MTSRRVTGLTELRRPSDEHRRLIRAVRLVARRAVVDHGCMFEEERTSFFGMAANTCVVQADEVRSFAMRIVTVDALHLTVSKWMRRAHERRVGLARMASGTLLVGGHDRWVLALVDHMATGAGNVRRLVRGDMPAHSLAIIVTREAERIRDRWIDTVRPKRNHRLTYLTLCQRLLAVAPHRPVACLALQPGRKVLAARKW